MRLILAYLLGYVVLIVRGPGLERFLNAALETGIEMWNVAWLGQERFCVSLALKDFWRLRSLAREFHCHFHVIKKKGMPFLWQRLRRRKMLLAGVVLFGLSIIYLSSFIWIVSVITEEPLKQIDPEELLDSARELGIAVGLPKYGCDPHRIEDILMERYPEIAWVGVEIRGIKVNIFVVEKTFPREEQLDKSPGDLVASQAGIVEEILVFSGEARVNRGDTVRAGQVLISGTVAAPAPEKETGGETGAEDNMLQRLVRAKGIVRGRVWYQVEETVPLRQEVDRITGRSLKVITLELPRRTVRLRGPESLPFSDFSTESDRRTLLNWRNSGLSVELVTRTYHEVEKTVRLFTEEEAKMHALDQGVKDIRRTTPGGARITDQRAEIISQNSQELKVRVTVESLEDISMRRAFN